MIINADDFGISPEVNAAVCECFIRRMISSTTLMVNMPYADEAVRLAKEYGFEERVGIHLNLTSGYPLTGEIRKYRRFCGKNGKFNAAFEKKTASRLSITQKETRAVQTEIEAQLRKYIEYGLPDHHLDSHHHVHTDRSIWKALRPLIHIYNIKSVRLSRNIYNRISVLKAVYKRSYNRGLRKSGVKTTDYFGSYTDYKNCAERLPDNALTEIMVHPMYDEYGILVDHRIPMESEKDFYSYMRAVYEFY